MKKSKITNKICIYPVTNISNLSNKFSNKNKLTNHKTKDNKDDIIAACYRKIKINEERLASNY